MGEQKFGLCPKKQILKNPNTISRGVGHVGRIEYIRWPKVVAVVMGATVGEPKKTYCRSCDERMWKPSLMDLSGIKFGFGLVYFLPVVFGTLALIIWGRPNPANDGDHFLAIGVTALIFIAIPARRVLWSSRKYAIW